MQFFMRRDGKHHIGMRQVFCWHESALREDWMFPGASYHLAGFHPDFVNVIRSLFENVSHFA
jgi:hypothetical protein